MTDVTPDGQRVQCPSAKPDLCGSVVIGVVGESAGLPIIDYLVERLPVSDGILGLASPARPTEVFRFAAPCAGHGCRHFDGAHCRLASRIVQLLPAVTESLPPCSLRPDCRWWQQEGKLACQRCPQIISEPVQPSPVLVQVATPEPAS
jgi:hypothetical protein